MPIFEFDCLECQKLFERLIGVGAGNDQKPTCPACGSTDVKKRFSTFGVGSKGGGESTSTGSGCSSCSSSSCASCH